LAEVPKAAPAGLRIVAADAMPEVRQSYQQILGRLGHQIQVAGTDSEVVEACRLLSPDLVLIAARQAGLDGLAVAEAAGRERPIPFVLVTDGSHCAARALATENVVACLPRPLEEASLATALPLAVRQFEQLRRLRADVDGLRQALDERKVIQRAKESTARRLRIPESEAYHVMRATASRQNRKLVDVANQVLAAEAIFAGLDVGSPA